MSGYEVGYRKPPNATKFKPGQSGNPAGRPKSKTSRLEKLILKVLQAPMQYSENGQTKSASRHEVAIKFQIEKAVKGSIDAAEMILAMRKHAMQHSDHSVQRILVTGGLPETLPRDPEDTAVPQAVPPIQDESGGA